MRALIFLLAVNAWCALVGDVRTAAMKGDFAAAEALLASYQKQSGVTAEYVNAHSWLGRGALAAKQWDKAEAYAVKSRELAMAELKKRPLDQDNFLPTGLGASIEVQAQALAGRNQRTEAVAFLTKELAAWRATSIRTRIQKNINLLTLEGKRAPALELKEFIGKKPPTFAQLRGKPVALFFWAHWCPDCKAEAPILGQLQKEFAPQGLVVMGPTQRYGYVAGGEDAAPAVEVAYIEKVQREFYGALSGMTVPLSEENFKNYGASTTPTLVLIDRRGIVRLYHPGRMTYEELKPIVAELVKGS